MVASEVRPRVLLAAQMCPGAVGDYFGRALTELGVVYSAVELDTGSLSGPTGLNRLLFSISRGVLAHRQWNKLVIEAAQEFRPNVLLVVKGAGLTRKTLDAARASTNATLVNFATDSPFNPAASHSSIRKAIPAYDLYISTKTAIINELRHQGAAAVGFVPFAYDPVSHFPDTPTTPDERRRFTADVAFIGGADADRASLLGALISSYGRGLDLAVYGGRWNRFPTLPVQYRGEAYGRDFRLAMSGAKIQLGLVRRANQDGHTMRTFEAVACGAFVISERTEEHLALFEEDREAVYFGSVEELGDKVRHYLANESERLRIATAARRRLLGSRNTYTDRVAEILALTAPFLERRESEARRS